MPEYERSSADISFLEAFNKSSGASGEDNTDGNRHRVWTLLVRASELGEAEADMKLAKLLIEDNLAGCKSQGNTTYHLDDLDVSVCDRVIEHFEHALSNQPATCTETLGRLAAMLMCKQRILDRSLTSAEVVAGLSTLSTPTKSESTSGRFSHLMQNRDFTELEERAVHLFEQIAEMDVAACWQLRQFFMSKGNSSSEIKWLRKLDKFHDDMHAQYLLGMHLKQIDTQKALSVLRRAAAAGHPFAKLELSTMQAEIKAGSQMEDTAVMDMTANISVKQSTLESAHHYDESAYPVTELEAYVCEHPDSITALSLLFGVYAFDACRYHLALVDPSLEDALNHNHIEQAFRFLSLSYLFDSKAVQWSGNTHELLMQYAVTMLPSSNVWVLIALQALEKQDLQQKLKLLTKASTLTNSDRLLVGVLHLRGCVHTFSGLWDKAITDFEAARSLVEADCSLSIWPMDSAEFLDDLPFPPTTRIDIDTAVLHRTSVALLDRDIGSASNPLMNRQCGERHRAEVHLNRFVNVVPIDTHMLVQSYYELANLVFREHKDVEESQRFADLATQAEKHVLWLFKSRDNSDPNDPASWNSIHNKLRSYRTAQKAKEGHHEAAEKCWNCDQRGNKLQICKGCKIAAFCSRKCQVPSTEVNSLTLLT